MIITICLSCVSIPKMFLNFTTFLSAAAGFFESLTFIAFSSDICKNYNCNFAWGAACAIGAIVVYFFNSCLLYSVPEYEREESDRPAAASTLPGTVNPPPGSVSVTQTVLPDGTKKTIRKTINAGKNSFFRVRAHRVRTTTLTACNTYSLQMDREQSRRRLYIRRRLLLRHLPRPISGECSVDCPQCSNTNTR